MENTNVFDYVEIVWNIKNIWDPTKESIEDYIKQWIWRVDSYLKTFIKRRPESKINVIINVEKTSNNMYIWSLGFDFPWVLQDFNVQIDHDTPESWLPQAIALLFDKAKSILSKEVERLHDR